MSRLRGLLADVAVWGSVAIAALIFAGVASVFLMMFLPMKVRAHDIYTGLQKDGTYGSTSPCCGETDCEGVAEADLQMHPDGSVSFRSRRHGVSILVAAERVVPAGLPPDKDGRVWAGTWCGAKRVPNYTPFGYADRPAGEGAVTPPTPDQPDPTFFTYCAFVAPGGA